MENDHIKYLLAEIKTFTMRPLDAYAESQALVDLINNQILPEQVFSAKATHLNALNKKLAKLLNNLAKEIES